MAHIVSTEKVFKTIDYVLFTLLTLVGFGAIFCFMISWFSFTDYLYSPIIFAIMTVMLMVVLMSEQCRWFILPYMRRPKPRPVKASWKVAAVTTFVPGVEPLEMLEETVQALMALDYPHDTWVLDEGDDHHVKALCSTLGAQYFSRKTLPCYNTAHGTFRSHSKHGNYNAWLAAVGFDTYDIVAAFDPDHVPEPTFLSHVLGYFGDSQVGYVQVAQAYYNQQMSFIARGAAEETYGFYSIMQMASYGMGSAHPHRLSDYHQMPQLIGSHNTHRITALRQIGGFAAHDADDLLATLLYWAHGWCGVYVPHILARGLAPVDWQGYLTQQYRWARSILDVKLRIYPQMSQHVSLQTRVVSILHGLHYLHKSLITLMALSLIASMLITGTVPKVFSVTILPKLSILLTAFLLRELYRQRFLLDWRKEWGWHWRAGLLYLAKCPYMFLALYDVISHRESSYVITKKVKDTSQKNMLLWPNIVIATFIGTAWGIGMLHGTITSVLLHICALTIILVSLALIASGYRHFPQPYDKSIRGKSPASAKVYSEEYATAHSRAE
jgi:cellulose synthase (UDP-forming)